MESLAPGTLQRREGRESRRFQRRHLLFVQRQSLGDICQPRLHRLGFVNFGFRDIRVRDVGFGNATLRRFGCGIGSGLVRCLRYGSSLGRGRCLCRRFVSRRLVFRRLEIHLHIEIGSGNLADHAPLLVYLVAVLARGAAEAPGLAHAHLGVAAGTTYD